MVLLPTFYQPFRMRGVNRQSSSIQFRLVDLSEQRIYKSRRRPFAGTLDQFHAVVYRRMRRNTIEEKHLIESDAESSEHFDIQPRQRLRRTRRDRFVQSS